MNIALPAIHVDLSFFRARRGESIGARIAPAPTRTHTLDKGATLVIDRPAGITVKCNRGSLWLTHDGDCKDLILDAGDEYVCQSRQRLMVHALSEATAFVA